jgi:hypothetical protein
MFRTMSSRVIAACSCLLAGLSTQACQAKQPPGPKGVQPAATTANTQQHARDAGTTIANDANTLNKDAAIEQFPWDEATCGPKPAYTVVRDKKFKILAAPAWPTAPNNFELRWMIGPPKVVLNITATKMTPEEAGSHIEHSIALIVLAGAVKLRIALGQTQGTYSATSQSYCVNTHSAHAAHPNKDGELSRIAFEQGGQSGYLVRLNGPGKLQIVQHSASDGQCSAGSELREVASLSVTPDVQFTESLIVQAQGQGQAATEVSDPCSADVPP